MDKEKICAAFCDEVSIRKVPAGYAVKTAFHTADGDPIGFYIVQRPDQPNRWRLEDSGLIVPLLEAHGVTLNVGQREESFKQLLSEYRADFDENSKEIVSNWMSEDDVATASLHFATLLLRLQDLEFLAPDVVESTFRQDAQRAIEQRFSRIAKIDIDGKISDSLPNYVVDAVISTQDREPVAVYFATSEPRVDEAVILAMESRLKDMPIAVLLLLEHVKPRNVTDRALARAHNLLDGLPVFRGFEANAMDKIATFVEGTRVRH
jgi:hypothetical protein